MQSRPAPLPASADVASDETLQGIRGPFCGRAKGGAEACGKFPPKVMEEPAILRTLLVAFGFFISGKIF